MRELEKIVNTNDQHITETIDLNEAYPQGAKNIGLRICYALATSPNIILRSVGMEGGEQEIGSMDKWFRQYEPAEFIHKMTTMERFLAIFDSDDFDAWEMTLVYQNTELHVGGQRSGSRIGISYPKTAKFNPLGLFIGVETDTYRWNDCDKDLLKTLVCSYQMTTKRAVIMLEKIARHPDIFDEFQQTINFSTRQRIDNAVCVEGYTAWALETTTRLNTIGAYNYLVYLREDPEGAKRALTAGLPVK